MTKSALRGELHLQFQNEENEPWLSKVPMLAGLSLDIPMNICIIMRILSVYICAYTFECNGRGYA